MPLIVTFTKPLHTHKHLLQFLAVPSFSFSSAIWGAFQKWQTHSGRHSIQIWQLWCLTLTKFLCTVTLNLFLVTNSWKLVPIYLFNL
jgi:hypothetical protein